jgi:predicted NAD/FAD-dependent oxidoreductase
MTREVAVVGAGAAGAGAAYVLDDADATVTVFEKSRGVCGRAATRRREGCRYDHGANYIKSGDDRVDELLTEDLDAAAALASITVPVQVVYGERDDTADWEPVVDRAGELGARVEELPADHFFVGQQEKAGDRVCGFFTDALPDDT